MLRTQLGPPSTLAILWPPGRSRFATVWAAWTWLKSVCLRFSVAVEALWQLHCSEHVSLLICLATPMPAKSLLSAQLYVNSAGHKPSMVANVFSAMSPDEAILCYKTRGVIASFVSPGVIVSVLVRSQVRTIAARTDACRRLAVLS